MSVGLINFVFFFGAPALIIGLIVGALPNRFHLFISIIVIAILFSRLSSMPTFWIQIFPISLLAFLIPVFIMRSFKKS